VEEGTTFCKLCNAPQIHVASPDSENSVAISGAPDLPRAFYRGATAIDWAKAFPAVLTAGIVSAMLMVIPLGAFGLGMFAAGILAVILYRRRAIPAPITPGMGARLGVATGGVGFAIFSLFIAIQVTVFHSGGELREAMIEAAQQAASRNPDPQVQELLAYLKTPDGLGFFMLLSLAVMLVGFLLFSSMGGAIGAVLLRPKNRPNDFRH
jgi:hypothetical protein